MRKATCCVLAFAVILLFNPASAQSLMSLSLGLRAGTVSLDDPNTDESLDGMTMFGGHLKIGMLPILDLEASFEFARKKYTFLTPHPSYIPPPGWDWVTAKAAYSHVSLNGSAKHNLYVPLSSFKPYLGVGLGMHRISSSVSLPVVPDRELPFNTDYSESRFGAHAMAGLQVSFPLFPVEIFAEGRYSIIFTHGESTEATSLYGGLAFKLR